jgi:hypothetical protein
MSLQQTALTKAIQILDAIKLPYAIMDGETKYGTLNVTPPKPEKGGKRKSPQFNNVAKFDYEKKLQEATPGRSSRSRQTARRSWTHCAAPSAASRCGAGVRAR